jgi:hypothetical protein
MDIRCPLSRLNGGHGGGTVDATGVTVLLTLTELPLVTPVGAAMFLVKVSLVNVLLSAACRSTRLRSSIPGVAHRATGDVAVRRLIGGRAAGGVTSGGRADLWR